MQVVLMAIVVFEYTTSDNRANNYVCIFFIDVTGML